MERKGAYYTKALGRKVAAAARPDRIAWIHVMRTSPSMLWSVVPQGRLRALRSSLKKNEAISFAKKTAIRLSADYIVVHDKNSQSAKWIPIHKKVPT